MMNGYIPSHNCRGTHCRCLWNETVAKGPRPPVPLSPLGDGRLLLLVGLLALSLLVAIPFEVHSDGLADGTWLSALYTATNGPGWTSSCRTGWNISNPSSVCGSPGWYRVTCNASDGSGVVISIDLHSCNLQGGPLPDVSPLVSGRVGTALQYCTALDLHSNSLTGTLQPSYSNMASLQQLDLSSNSLTGTLPSSFGDMSSLQTLYLYSNSLTGNLPSSFSNMTSLQELYLCYNSLTGSLPSSYSSLSALRTLKLFSNSLSGALPSTFSSLSSLQDLSLYANSLSGTVPPSFSSLSSLQVLYLHSNSLTGSLPSSFSSLSSLHSLSLYSNSLVGTLPSSWYTLQPTSPGSYDVTFNYLTGDIPSSWLWSNATIRGTYFTGNCLNVSNMTAVTATSRFTAGTPRSDASVCAAVAAAQAAPPRTRSHSATDDCTTSASPSRSVTVPSRSVSTERVSASTSVTRSPFSETRSGASHSSLSVSTSVASLSVSMSVSGSRSASVLTSRSPAPLKRGVVSGGITSCPLTDSSLVSSSASSLVVTSILSSSLSSSACEEMPLCWVRQATSKIVDTCEGMDGGCVLLGPGSQVVLPGTVAYAQVSRKALDKNPFGSLMVYVECIRPRFLRLVNRSSAALSVVATVPVKGNEGLELVQLLLPGVDRGSWSLQHQSQYNPFTMELPLAAECGDRVVNMTLVVLVTPLLLPQLAVGGAVQATDRAAIWLGAIGGSSGGGVSRVAAVRSLLLCSKEGASTGGLLGLSLHRPSDVDGDDGLLLANARGAIVGNVMVFVGWLVVLLALAGVYHHRVALPTAIDCPGLAACVRVALPSSLLPVSSALFPSLSGGVLILAAVGKARLDVLDAVTLVAGCCVLAAVLAPLLWLCAPSFATGILFASVVSVDDGDGGGDRSALLRSLRDWWRRIVKPRWMWRPLLSVLSHPAAAVLSHPEAATAVTTNSPISSIDPLHNSSLAAHACGVILSEHRFLWYAALDVWSLCATGLLGATSGVMDESSSSSVCSGAAIALTVLFLLQFTVMVVARPLTSVFANVHGAFVLLLTGLGTALQAASIARRRGSIDIDVEDWALLGAAVCGFLVVGASIVRFVLLDAPHTIHSARKFFLEVSVLKSAIPKIRFPESEESEELLRLCSPQPTLPPPQENECSLDEIGVDALNRDFWDDVTGDVLVVTTTTTTATIADDVDGFCCGDNNREEVLLLHFRV